jgi:hypothetical protein
MESAFLKCTSVMVFLSAKTPVMKTTAQGHAAGWIFHRSCFTSAKMADASLNPDFVTTLLIVMEGTMKRPVRTERCM